MVLSILRIWTFRAQVWARNRTQKVWWPTLSIEHGMKARLEHGIWARSTEYGFITSAPVVFGFSLCLLSLLLILLLSSEPCRHSLWLHGGWLRNHDAPARSVFHTRTNWAGAVWWWFSDVGTIQWRPLLNYGDSSQMKLSVQQLFKNVCYCNKLRV